MSNCCGPDPGQASIDGPVVLDAVITCPHCHTVRTERMPIDACVIAYECTGCSTRLRPKPGDCCVFCSYASVPCPPVQAASYGA
jgi:hypothetical protein